MILAWVQCLCHVWPIAPGATVGRCGRCGSAPVSLVPAPADGKACAL